MTRVTIYIVFLVIQLCNLWCTSFVAGQQSSNNAIARVTSVKNGEKDEYMEAVEDKTADSGWAIKFKKPVSKNWMDNYLYVYMWAIEKDKPAFRHAFFVKDEDDGTKRPCQFISNDTSHQKFALGNFMPSQVMDMIFSETEGSCELKNGTRAIQSKAPVNADRRDRSNGRVGIPYTFPFQLIVNIVNFYNSTDTPLYGYIFQVNFTVDSMDNESPGKQENSNNNEKSQRECLGKQWNYGPAWRICTAYEFITRLPKKIGSFLRPSQNSKSNNSDENNKVDLPYECRDAEWPYYIVWRACPDHVPTYMAANSEGPMHVPARIINVNATEENDYFSAVKDNRSEIGWAVKTETVYARPFWETWFTFEIFYVDPSDKSVQHIFSAYLCDVLAFDSRYDGFPEKDFLPRQLVDVIFPGYQGTCDLQDETTTPMKSNTTVNLNPYQNPRVNLPKATYFNLLAAIRPESWRNESYEVNYVLVNFTIGNPQSSNTADQQGSKYICFNRHWNYLTVWGICKVAEFFESGIFGMGRLILDLF